MTCNIKNLRTLNEVRGFLNSVLHVTISIYRLDFDFFDLAFFDFFDLRFPPTKAFPLRFITLALAGGRLCGITGDEAPERFTALVEAAAFLEFTDGALERTGCCSGRATLTAAAFAGAAAFVRLVLVVGNTFVLGLMPNKLLTQSILF